MSEKNIIRDLLKEPTLRRLLEDTGTLRIGLGPIPEGHDGPYHPTPDELQEGFRRVIDSNTALANALAEVASEELRQGDSEQQEDQ